MIACPGLWVSSCWTQNYYILGLCGFIISKRFDFFFARNGQESHRDPHLKLKDNNLLESAGFGSSQKW